MERSEVLVLISFTNTKRLTSKFHQRRAALRASSLSLAPTVHFLS
jgi:hypothetical protein